MSHNPVREGEANPKVQDGGNAVRAPSISLPKGGGAIRGIGEKFAANPVTGTGSMTVPIATSPGRSGFGPQLSLSYDSGAGNGPFGFGWDLSLPSITRKTDKGLPKYQDADESDVFILSGAEDLVPVLINYCEGWKRDESIRTIDGKPYCIKRYRPRIEGLFARIERWTNEEDPSDILWRSISKDNITTWYGKTAESRIANPGDPTHVFSWLICESHDDKGNVIVYQYKEENSDSIDRYQAHERNRTKETRSANRYLKYIKYGNRTPYYPSLKENEPPTSLPCEWFFEVVFDYGEHHPDSPTPITAPGLWPCRNDPFSIYRSGFEVRTYRLCQRVLMFHHFPDEPGVGANCLVRSTDFTYSYEEDPTNARNPIFSFLLSATQSGYRRLDNAAYLKKSLPPLEFEYTQPTVREAIQEVDPESLENLPYGLDGARYQWVDLDGEGLSGILTEQDEGWLYKGNLSPINVRDENGVETVAARFGPVELVAKKPSLVAIRGGRQQFLDLAGDGQLDLVELEGSTPGFYERTHDESWGSFLPFESLPVLDWNSRNLKFVDLTGDGHADVLVNEEEAFCWHASLAEAGFGPAQRVHQVLDEEKGPRLVFADGIESIYLADLSGDGLTDMVRIRNGEVCYWPNVGYGRFGAKVTMDNAPWFDNPDLFDQRRIQLADIDGSGVTDIIYVGRDGVRLYFNQSGNSWSKPRELGVFPAVDNLSSVQVADLLGNGTACLVWSSPLLGETLRPMRYVDLMGGQKPHLLVKTVNNLGAETHVRYAPSTKFYLMDKVAGKPWITRLPFPVHVVEQVETYDRISRNRFVTRYAYHHGYFDGIEREFRGFGMVEQFDTEEMAVLTTGGTLPDATNTDAASHIPPVHTKTWFHTGVYLGREHISDFFAGLLDARDTGHYYRETGLTDVQARQLLLDDTVLPVGLTTEEEREACRALKGSMLRQEVYALDGTDQEQHPYTLTEQNFTIRRVQLRAGNRHAVFFMHAREAINYHYERNPADPRISHALTLEVDEFGNVLKSSAIGYGRRQPDMTLLAEDRAKQAQIFINYTDNRVTNAIEAADDYRTPLPCETRTYELTGLTLPAGHNRFTLAEMLTGGTGAASIAYEQNPTAGVLQKRLIEHLRTLYRPDDLGEAQNDPLVLLPLGTVEPLALPGESYKLAFTPGLLAGVYGGRVTDVMLETEGRYLHSEGDANWWIPAGRMFYSPGSADTSSQELAFARQHFFLPHRYRDPFHTNAVSTETFVTFDAYDLLMVESRDPLGNRVTVGERDVAGNLTTQGNDYRVLQPRLMMDPNRNRTEVAFDTLGMVVGTAVMGKPQPTPTEGDSLDGFEADLTEAAIFDHLANPLADPHAILQQATTRLVYDLFAYQRTKNQPNPQSAVVYTLARETHDSDPVPAGGLKIQHSVSYSDGFGREIQKKIQAEAGPVPKRDANGKIIVGADGQPEMTPNDVSPRWVGSGWTVFNNKGKPVRQYEPFFTDTHRFEFDVRIGVSPVLFYDPVERVVATLHPNHTWEKVVFDPWRQKSWDVNDTVLIVDPKDDSDVGDYFRRLPDADYLPTWYTARNAGALGTQEKAAAIKAGVHANTPAVAHLDSLGRTVLTIAHNKLKSVGAADADPPADAFYSTRVVFDIEGNQRAVLDARDRAVMRYDYDMLGSVIHSTSMDADNRWMLNDVAGKPIHAWDSRGHEFTSEYDPLHRPLKQYVKGTDAALSDTRVFDRNVLFANIEYGENQANAIEMNLRTRAFKSYDNAGVVISEAYDFKGNSLRATRQLVADYKAEPDWSGAVTLAAEIFASRTIYDALNRPISVISPDNSEIKPIYNEANLLEKVEARLRGADAWTAFIADIEYDAKGQRELIVYGNGVTRAYDYDPLTFRLIRLRTTRATDGDLQNLSYTYDPIGNITEIQDGAQQTIFFANSKVSPNANYTYDPIYQLINAEGREHIGQAGPVDQNDPLVQLLPHPNNGEAMRRYTEQYEYDPVGNILKMLHQANGGGWNRAYTYQELSLIEPGKTNNRLSSITIGSATEPYTYNAHGSMARMPHLADIQLDFKEQMREVDLGGGGTAYYVYDAAGQRVRKVHEHNGSTVEERIYLGNFEIYRKHVAGNLTFERETLHLLDGQKRVAMVETITIDDALSLAERVRVRVRYQLDNHLGSACLELDDTGRMISYEEYHPYGTTAYHAADGSLEVSRKRYRYAGKEKDEETGLYYQGARYYPAWLARWCSVDPAGMSSGVNLYRFIRNDPINFRDPSGQAEAPAAAKPPPRCTGSDPEGVLPALWDPNASFTDRLKAEKLSLQLNAEYVLSPEYDAYMNETVMLGDGSVMTRAEVDLHEDFQRMQGIFQGNSNVLGSIFMTPALLMGDVNTAISLGAVGSGIGNVVTARYGGAGRGSRSAAFVRNAQQPALDPGYTQQPPQRPSSLPKGMELADRGALYVLAQTAHDPTGDSGPMRIGASNGTRIKPPQSVSDRAVAIAEVKLPNGSNAYFASGSDARLDPAQREVLEKQGIPPQNIFAGTIYRSANRLDNHAEQVIMRNLPEGAIVKRWGISWKQDMVGAPCFNCAINGVDTTLVETQAMAEELLGLY